MLNVGEFNDMSIFSVQGKTALVTGGTGGIGFMIAEGFVKAGVKTYIASRKIDACEAAQAKLSEFGTCIALVADVSTEAGCIALVDEIKSRESTLDILVNNAGTTWGAPLEEYPDKAWDRINNLNIKASFTLSKFLLPLLTKAGDKQDPSRIINITSVAGTLTCSMDAYAYGPSKAALNHLTKILANELAEKNITVNAIAPGVFPSKMTSHATATEEKKKAQEDLVPLGRLGQPEDVQGLTQFLCSPAGSYVTGNIIALDGGSTVKPASFL